LQTWGEIRALIKADIAPGGPKAKDRNILSCFSNKGTFGRTFHVKQHRLVLQGGSADRLRIPIELLRDMLGAVQDGARHAARFYVEGHSSQAGPRPRWLEACTAHLVTG
jgi:hypothetical protein